MEESIRQTKIGSGKICPLMTVDTDYPVHCLDSCEWNDGEGCGIWRVVKAMDNLKISVETIEKIYGRHIEGP